MTDQVDLLGRLVEPDLEALDLRREGGWRLALFEEWQVLQNLLDVFLHLMIKLEFILVEKNSKRQFNLNDFFF